MTNIETLHIVSITQVINDETKNSFLAFKKEAHALDFFADKFFYYSELHTTIETELDRIGLKFTCVFDETSEVQVEVKQCRYMKDVPQFSGAKFLQM